VLLHFLGFHCRPILISASKSWFFVPLLILRSPTVARSVVPIQRQQIHFPTHIFSAWSEERVAGSLPRLDCPCVSLIAWACSSSWPGSSVPQSCSVSGVICSLVDSVVWSPLVRHGNQFALGIFSVQPKFVVARSEQVLVFYFIMQALVFMPRSALVSSIAWTSWLACCSCLFKVLGWYGFCSCQLTKLASHWFPQWGLLQVEACLILELPDKKFEFS
jgi:hypothetical protein